MKSFFSKLPANEKSEIAELYRSCSLCECIIPCKMSKKIRDIISSKIGRDLSDNEDEFEALYKHINNS